MADDAIFIVTVGGGKCLENTQDAYSVLDCIPKAKDNQCQKWRLETHDSDPNIVAFRSCLDGQYLRNNEPHKINWGRIGMGEKQWWTLEKGKNPGSCLIRSNECKTGASYLNDFEGVYRDRNKVHMWQMVEARQFWLDWYLMPTTAEFNPRVSAAASPSEGSGSEVAANTTAESESREAAVRKREQDLAAREKDGGRSGQKGDDSGAKAAALKGREQELARREQALCEREADNASAPQENGGTASADSNDGGHDDGQLELLKRENENLKLKLRIQELEQQLKEASRKPASKVPNSKGNVANKKDPVVYDCGHVAYPPPRKLRRHAVGILYEGLDQPFELSERQRATLARHEHH